MNSKGQTGFFYLFMIGIVLFVLAISLAVPLVTNANAVRSTMDCNNASISTDQKVACTTIDISSPWLVGVILVLGATALGAKLSGIGQ